MNNPEDRERELSVREEELQAKERELRLRELEVEIHQEQQIRATSDYVEPALHKTRKHNPPENSLQKLSRKSIKFVKFIGFVVLGIAVIRAGLFVGIWITYLVMAGIIAGIGYQIFLKDDD